MPVNVIILAAGQGTRMNSDLPKVLHPLAGAPLLVHAMKSGLALSPGRLIVVVGTGAEAVARAARDFWPETVTALQEETRGTGHAVLAAAQALEGAEGDALVLYGDTPFVTPETLGRMLEARARADIVVLGFESRPEERYGRLVTRGDQLERIVEWADADAPTRAIALHNSGVVMADAATMLRLLARARPDNAGGEIYLTDIVELGRAEGLSATVVRCTEDETIGVNSREHLARAEEMFQTRARAALLADGVTLKAPGQVILAHDTVIGRDALIEGPCVFGPGVTVESGAHVRPFCHLEGCHISRGASVGPFARLRPGAELAEHVHVGNFVEVKNAIVAEGAKINHLTYVGDADVGERTNIGAGTITANYDGVFKHRTVIGADAFIGSNTVLVAPVRVGDGAMTATGSVVNRDVPAGAMAIARARQEVKEGFATRFFANLRARKAAQKKG
ncbi:MAG: bifunctional UDP-N-acetylglucosamine diphosphorylase/glucosamine-1-phosphate N-acetyltransferase GlmU [Rubellimicrobium sp.]|nr:bifunctional UDP-N-acetylglucosamine diphosphorylase/glucosamine-1-phosphate N-acetyltransferase GlmU [Rubellimicrobium sp.]